MRGEYPVRANGLGGRQVRTGPEFGHIYVHFTVIYEYANGVKLFSHTRQQVGCRNDIMVYVLGSRGRAEMTDHRHVITGAKPWQQRDRSDNFYQTEHNALFASIRKGQPINDGEYMSKSTLLAIMGRMACYTGQQITWEMALNSKEDLTPPRYEWGPIATPPVAMPGVTRFV
jgi:hypothetical protein